jgi:DNA-binding HxlR family transcriptional regulator
MEKECPVAKIIDILSKKYNLLIIRQLDGDKNTKKRFNELIKEINGISSRTLSKRLKELEKAKIINKTMFNEIPPRVEYSLTDSGKCLMGCFKSLNNWAKKYG